jgi:hypothetical protein
MVSMCQALKALSVTNIIMQSLLAISVVVINCIIV